MIRDDGSSDKTKEIVRARIDRGDHIFLIEGKNLGFAMSFMSLVAEAYQYIDRYDYYAFCDQDDVWLPRKLVSAVNKIRQEGASDKPNLYWSNFTLVDEKLNPLSVLTKQEHKSSNNQKVNVPTMTKPTILVRYFMLGCTMVFDRKMLAFLNEYKPKNKLTMHDLWLSQTAIFFGNILYDDNSYLLYRQHGSNAAGVDNSWQGRWKRFMKSFKTYERRHFREINARNFLNTYKDILSEDDYKLVESVALYKKSIKNRIELLKNKEISMGSFSSDMFIKLRIIFGVF